MAKDGIDGFFLNCQLDEKFELIEAEFGLKGFAIIIKLLQRIYGEHGYYCEYNSDISLLLAVKWNVASSGGDADNLRRQLPAADNSSVGGCHNLIDQVVAASVRRGIFDKTMYEKYGILTSVGIQKRYMTATRKRVDVVLKNEYLLLNDVKNGKTDGRNGKTDGRNGKTDVHFEQSKVKESKVKEINTCANRFNDFFSAYPKQKNMIAAEREYNLLLFHDQSLKEQELIVAAENYADAVSILGTEERYIKNPDRFLKDGTYLDYLDANYTKPKPPGKKRDANAGMMRTDYGDLSELEKELLSN